MKLSPFVFFKQKNFVIPRECYLEFMKFIFLELKLNFFAPFLNNVITNLSLFLDNSRKLL